MLTCLIADDEAPARTRLRRLLQPFVDAGRLRVAGEAADGVEAVALLEKAPVDLAFLDVKMPGLDGFGVLERVAPDRRPDVVFTTAYHDFALRAFEENAVDYLLKPVSRERLEQSVARAEARAVKRRADDAPAPPSGTETAPEHPAGEGSSDERLARLLDWLDAKAPSEAPVRPAERLRQLSVPHRDRLVILPVEAIVSIEVQDSITRIYALNEDRDAKAPLRQYLVPHTLEHLEAHLDPDEFLRVHRSAVVQLRHIREMVPWFSGRYKLVLTGAHEVIASRERSRVLRDRLML